MKKERPKYVLAKVNKPKVKKETNELLIPLITLPDTRLMEATICYAMMENGYTWKEVKRYRGNCIPHDWTKAGVYDHIARNGTACYPNDVWGHVQPS